MKRLFRASGTGMGSFIIGATSFLSYVIGLVRDKILAYVFGTSVQSDIYNAAFIIPDFILNACILGALSGVFIPIFIEHIHEGQEKADELGSIFISIMSTFVVAVSIVAMIFADQLVPLTVGGLTPERMAEAVLMTRVMLIYPIILGLSNTFGAVLQSYGHFMSYGLSSVLYNVGIIVGTLVLTPYFGVVGAGVGVLFGYVAHMLVRLYEMRHVPFRYRPKWNFQHPAFRTIILMMLPRAVTLLTVTVVVSQFSIISSQLGDGVFAAQNFARNFQSFAITLFGASIATAAMTEFSRHRAKKDTEAFATSFSDTVSQTLFFTIPAAVGLYFVAKPMLTLFLSGGAFDERSLAMTTAMLMIFAISVPSEGLMHVYSRGLYAMKRVYLPTIASLCYCFVTIVSLQLLVPVLAEQAIPTAWVLGSIVQIIVLMVLFHRAMHVSIRVRPLLKNQAKILFASLLMGGALWGIAQLPLDSMALFFLEVSGGSLVFIAVAYLLAIQEWKQLEGFLLRLAVRLKGRILPMDTHN